MNSKKVCRKTRECECIVFVSIIFESIDLKKRDEGRYCFCKDCKDTYIECTLQTKAS